MSTERPPLRLVETAVDDVGPGDRPSSGQPRSWREADGLAADDDVEDVEDDPARAALSPRFAIAALIVLQLLAAASFWAKYAALAHGEAQYRVAAALSGVASLCLYAGAALLVLRPGRGRALFLVAAAGFGLSLPAWGIGYGWSWPMAFGAILALAGAWFARAASSPDDAPGALP